MHVQGPYCLEIDEAESAVKGRRVRISVYGLGHVGLVSSAALVARGFNVIGVDKDPRKVENLSRGRVEHPDRGVREAISEGVRRGLLKITSDGVEASRESEIKIVDVPLDWGPGSPDFSNIDDAIESIARGMKRCDIVVVETTVPPGTTGGRVRDLLEKISGLRCGSEFGLAHSPQRLMVERGLEDLTRRYPKIVGGVDEKSPKILEILYREISSAGVIRVSSSTVAEFEKIAEGIYRDVNIALANELARAARELGVDFEEAAQAARTNPHIDLHEPGAGVGGVSLTTQPYLLAWSLSREWFWEGIAMRARKINEEQPARISALALEGLRMIGIAPRDAKVALLGISYRGGVGDTRRSPALEIVESLARGGVEEIAAHDPVAAGDRGLSVRLLKNLDLVLKGANCVILATDHAEYRGLTTGAVASRSGEARIVIVDPRGLIARKGSPGPGISCIYTTAGSPWRSCW